MKRAFLIVAACAHTPAAPAQRFAASDISYRFVDPDRRAKLDAGLATLDVAIADELAKRTLEGVAIGVVIDGELVYAKGFGVVAPGSSAVPDADTVYRIGSLSKSFTALALLQLRDAGAVRLDNPVAMYFPAAAQIAYPTHDARPITLRQLATHTSGLPRDVGAHANPTIDDIAKELASVRLEHVPGGHFEYSNSGYGLLSIVVSRVAHAPLRDVLQDRIFGPLGMTSTSFARPPKMAPAIADGKITDAQEVLGVEEGAGGIYSTVRDMAKYVAFELSAYPPRDAPESPVLRRATLREALDTGVFAGRSASRTATYGFGWGHHHTCSADDLIEHNGHVDSFQSMVELETERGIGVIALSNFGDPGPVADRVLEELARTGALQPYVAVYQPVPMLDVAMRRFLAIYDHFDEAALRALLSRPMIASEPAEIAGYRAQHGSCTRYQLEEVLGPRRAKFSLACERGAFEVVLAVDDKGVLGFEGGEPTPAEVARLAADGISLIGAWDEATFQRSFANAGAIHDTIESGAAALRPTLGSCTVDTIAASDKAWKLGLSCTAGPRTGKLEIVDGKITHFQIDPPCT